MKYFAAISQVLNIWLLDLQEVGVDLASYGAEEKALHLAGKVDNSLSVCIGDARSQSSNLWAFLTASSRRLAILVLGAERHFLGRVFGNG